MQCSQKGLYRYVQIRSEDLVRLLINEYRARECDQLILAFLLLIDWETGPTLDSTTDIHDNYYDNYVIAKDMSREDV